MVDLDVSKHNLKIMIIFTFNNKNKLLPVIMENSNNFKCSTYLDVTVDKTLIY